MLVCAETVNASGNSEITASKNRVAKRRPADPATLDFRTEEHGFLRWQICIVVTSVDEYLVLPTRETLIVRAGMRKGTTRMRRISDISPIYSNIAKSVPRYRFVLISLSLVCVPVPGEDRHVLRRKQQRSIAKILKNQGMIVSCCVSCGRPTVEAVTTKVAFDLGSGNSKSEIVACV